MHSEFLRGKKKKKKGFLPTLIFFSLYPEPHIFFYWPSRNNSHVLHENICLSLSSSKVPKRREKISSVQNSIIFCHTEAI